MPDNRIYQMPEVDAAQMKLMLDSLVINKTLLEMRVTQTESLSISSKIGLLREAALVDDLIHLLRLNSNSHGMEAARKRLLDLETIAGAEVSAEAPPKAEDR
jgi:hypothetical protein